MKQLFIFIVSGVLSGIFEEVDAMFGNNLGVDEICVLSSYTYANWVTYILYSLGTYAYRVTLKNVRNCISIQLSISITLSILISTFRVTLAHVFTLTDIQYDMLADVFRAMAVILPVHALGNFFDNYIRLNGLNKCMLTCNTIYYFIMLASDWIVVRLGFGCVGLIYTTGLSWLIYDIIVFIWLKVWRFDDKIEFSTIKELIKFGKDITIYGILGETADVIYVLFASTLGTYEYAIFAIGYRCGCFTEYVTDQLYDYTIFMTRNINSKKERFDWCIKTIKKLFIPMSLSAEFCGIVVLFIVHGSVSIEQCLPYTLLFLVQPILIQAYEVFRAYHTSCKQAGLVKYAAVFDIILRIVIIALTRAFDLGLTLMALACALGFFCRGIYFIIVAKHQLKKEEILSKA